MLMEKPIHWWQHIGPIQMSLGVFLEWIECCTFGCMLKYDWAVNMWIAGMNLRVLWWVKEAIIQRAYTIGLGLCSSLAQSYSMGEMQGLLGNTNIELGRCWGQWLFFLKNPDFSGGSMNLFKCMKVDRISYKRVDCPMAVFKWFKTKWQSSLF